MISDQYATQTIVTNDGRTITGMVSPVGDGSLVVLQANGEKLTLTKDEIEETKRAKHSAMPEGLLNALTLEEVADLFAYLTKPPASERQTRPSRRPDRPKRKRQPQAIAAMTPALRMPPRGVSTRQRGPRLSGPTLRGSNASSS